MNFLFYLSTCSAHSANMDDMPYSLHNKMAEITKERLDMLLPPQNLIPIVQELNCGSYVIWSEPRWTLSLSCSGALPTLHDLVSCKMESCCMFREILLPLEDIVLDSMRRDNSQPSRCNFLNAVHIMGINQ